MTYYSFSYTYKVSSESDKNIFLLSFSYTILLNSSNETLEAW